MASAHEHLAKAASEIQHKRAAVIPTIDFTVHTLDDGTTVHTNERVVKEVLGPFVLPIHTLSDLS